MIELWTVEGWGAFIQLSNPGPFSHYWINNETTFWNDPPRRPWAAHRFPLNLYSSAIAPEPGQQLLPTTSKWHVGATTPHPAAVEYGGEEVKWRRSERMTETGGERERERGGRWTGKSVSIECLMEFLSSVHVCRHCEKTVAEKIHKGPSWKRLLMPPPHYSSMAPAPQPAHLTEWTDSVQCCE